MCSRTSSTILGLVLMWSVQAFGQAERETIIGCLTARGDRAGFYSIKEEGTGVTILVTGLDDLAHYTAGQKVRLTGKTVREQDEDLFRVSKIEQLATTCEPAPLPKSMKEAMEQSTFGVRGGVGFDPAIIYMGVHAQLGPIVEQFVFLAPAMSSASGRSPRSTRLTSTACISSPWRLAIEAPSRLNSGTFI